MIGNMSSETGRTKNLIKRSDRGIMAISQTFLEAAVSKIRIFSLHRYEELCRTDDDDDAISLDSGEVRVTPPTRPRLRIREEVREQHCRTLRQALHVWLDQFPDDFDDPPNYPTLTQLEAFCRRVLPNTELDIKVHRKASQIRRPPEAPLYRLGYPVPPGSKPPPLLLKSASLIHSNNNNVLLSPNTKDLRGHHHHSSAGGHSHPDSHYQVYADFLEIPEAIFAHQLTRMDCVGYLKISGGGAYKLY
jgi:hypothetical protein